MSGVNNQASKITRYLSRQADIDAELVKVFALLRLNHETDTQSIAKQAAIIKSQDEYSFRLTVANTELTATNTLLAETVQRQQNTIELLSKTAHRQDAEIVSLRRQLGLALAKLHKPSVFDKTFPFLAIPTLDEKLEPRWGNNHPLPHTNSL